MRKKPVARGSSSVEIPQNEAEIRHQRMFDAAEVGILLLNADSGEIRDVNHFLLNLLGLKLAELLGRKLWEIGLLEDEAASQAAFEELRAKGYIRYENLMLKTKAGRYVEVEFINSAYPVGVERVIQCNIRDISEQRHSDREIQDLAKFPDENPNPVLRVDHAGVILYANEASQLLLSNWGVRQGETAPQLWFGLIAEVLARGATRVFNMQVGERTYSFSVVPILDEGYVYLYGRDITENRELLRKIKAKDDLLRLTGKMAKVGGWEFDAQTLQGIWSDEVASIYGMHPEQETNVSIELSFYKPGSREKFEFAIQEALELVVQPCD
jgi:PAS domain S-box-containing protein